MTSPDNGGRVKLELDELQSAGSRWNLMSGDLHVGNSPHPGNDPTDPTALATVAIHGTMNLTTAQLQEMLQSYANGTQNTASAFGAQDKGSASQMKDMLGMLTSGGKDLMGIVTNVGQTATQALTQVGTAVTQAGTTAMNAAMTAGTTAPKANAPGGSVAGGLIDPNNINHEHATTNSEGKDNGRFHDSAKSVSR